MSQASEILPSSDLINASEIHELAMSSHSYIQQAIWWVRLAKALDVLAEEIICANISRLSKDLAGHRPEMREDAAALDEMGDEALRAIDATRKHVSLLAGESSAAAQVRDSVKWVWKRVQLMNCLFEDLSLDGGRTGERASQGRRLRSVPMQ